MIKQLFDKVKVRYFKWKFKEYENKRDLCIVKIEISDNQINNLKFEIHVFEILKNRSDEDTLALRRRRKNMFNATCERRTLENKLRYYDDKITYYQNVLNKDM